MNTPTLPIYQPSAERAMRFVNSHRTAVRVARDLHMAKVYVWRNWLAKAKLVCALKWAQLTYQRFASIVSTTLEVTRGTVLNAAMNLGLSHKLAREFWLQPLLPIGQDAPLTTAEKLAKGAQAQAKPDKFAVVTARIMNEQPQTAAAKKPRKQFRTPTYTGRAQISDRYGDGLREEVAKMHAADGAL